MELFCVEEKALGLRLRSPNEEDMELLRTMLNDPEIKYLVIGWGLPVGATEQMSWFHEIYLPQDNRMCFMIEKDGNTIGCIILDKIDWEMKTGEMGIKVLRVHRGTRTTVDASKLFLKYCFLDLDMQCIHGCCLSLQRATIRLIKTVGYTEEGRQRSSIYKHGKRHDIVHFAMTRQAYLERGDI